MIMMRKKAQSGFTLLELMIATTVAVFLLGGLFVTLQSTRDAYQQQTALAQLQDNERLAMTLIAGVVESSGYFPAPQTNLSTTFFSSGGVWLAANQVVVGTANAVAPGDTLTVRYGAAANDNVYDCKGGTTTAVKTMVNTFKVAADASGVSWLQCTNDGGATWYPLVRDVTDMQIVYGVHLGATTGSCTDTYQTSTQMVATPTNWSSVCSVRVTLYFTDFVTKSTGAATPVAITRTIALMNTAGANI
jgi:type IV pilus assembly protein PilW